MFRKVFIFFSFLVLSTEFLLAQQDKETSFKAAKVSDTSMSLSKGTDEFFFNYPHLAEKGRFYNKQLLQKIDHLVKNKQLLQLIPLLENYTSQFRILNFSQDTDLLWKLAQCYEATKQTKKATATYRLVLKHHRKESIQEIQQYFRISRHYDQMTELEKHYFVPLDYYYELLDYRKKIDTLTPPHSVLTNMGEEINQWNAPDYGPSINSNDELMIFTRRTIDTRYMGNKPSYNENLYYSQKVDELWEFAKPFPKPIQSKCNEGSSTMSGDGSTIIFTRCVVPEYSFDCPDCLGDCDLYISDMTEDSSWSQPVNLGPKINTKSWESQPYLSDTEDTLYFVSDRKDGFGLTDIYYSVKNKKDVWGPSVNMGPTINTRGSEFSPFFSRGVFYFASNGQILNLAENANKSTTKTLDIYKVYRYLNYWKEPINIGPLVNGNEDEYYFSMDRIASHLFYAKTENSVKNKLNTDIYSFPVPMEARPNANTHLSGSLTDSETGTPYKGIVSIIDLENGIEVAPREVRKDGSFDFDLIDHNRYLLVVQGNDFFRIERLFELEGDTAINVEAVSVANRKLLFSSIEFEQGKAEILPEMEKDLWDVINFMIDNHDFTLTIGGHTDSHGNPEANLKLSQNRADSIKEFLVKKGTIDSVRITATGYGDTQPIKSPEITEEDTRINRRVEFNISKVTNSKGDTENKE